ncbi:unnamed protein product, partial [Gulo gulo]
GYRHVAELSDPRSERLFSGKSRHQAGPSSVRSHSCSLMALPVAGRARGLHAGAAIIAG